MSSTIDPEKFTYQLGVSEKDQEEWIKRYLQKIRENKEMAKYKEFQAATTTPEALKKSFSGVLEKFDLERLEDRIQKMDSGAESFDANSFSRSYPNFEENPRYIQDDVGSRLNMKLEIDPETGDMFSVRYDPVKNHYELKGLQSGEATHWGKPREYVKEMAHLRMTPEGHVTHAGATYDGVRKKVMDRLVMEAAARDMVPSSNNLSSAGARFVNRWKDKFEKGQLDKLIEKFAKTGKVTDKFWASLPVIGKALTAAGIASAPNPAEAAADFGIDMASAGVLTPGELGKGTLPPEELAKRKTHNAKIKLQKLKEQQQLRQQKRMSNESNFRNLY